MNGKVFVGQKALSLTEYEKTAPISGVILWVDDENCYEAGDETGTVIEQDCPYATQQMANNLLATLQGYSYQGLEANGAKVSPIAELGDGITVNGLYTQLAYQNIRFSTGEVMDVAAPGKTETLHEYQTEGYTTQQFTHQLAETRSLISKTSEEILLQVENELKGLSSSFSVQLQQITARVNGLEGDFTEVSVTLDGLTVTDETGKTVINGSMVQTTNLFVSAANITGTLTANQIDATNLKVNAANITGSLTIGQLPNDVATTDEIPKNVSELSNDEGYQTERGVVEIIDGTVTADYVNALAVRARYLQGREVSLLASSGKEIGTMEIVDTSTGDGLSINTVTGGIRIQSELANVFLEGGSGGPSILLSSQEGVVQLSGDLVLSSVSYGSREPSGSAKYGTVYFQLE